jgi:hypothetical protein
MNIGQPKRIIEIEPVVLPVPGEIVPDAVPETMPDAVPAGEPRPDVPDAPEPVEPVEQRRD